ncbi:MAG: hypothetical protein JNK87_36210 [Bryobacterales bacterium]|nr:hypothetical protein [Bryobacterales bacterium]
MKRKPAASFVAASLWLALFASASQPLLAQTLAVTPNILQFNTSVGVAPPSQQVTLTSTPTALNFAAFANYVTGPVSGVNWLQVTPGTGTANSTVTIAVVNANQLTAGTYTATVSFVATAFSNVFSTVNVTLTVTGSGTGSGSLSALPTNFTFNYTPGGSVPSAQLLQVFSSLATSYSALVTISSGSTTWLQISPSSAPSGTSASFTVTPVNYTSLAVGTYSATITIVSGLGNTLQVPVTLVVGGTGGGSGFVSPSSVSLGSSAGQTTPSQQIITLNPGFNTNFTVSNVTTNSGGAWLTVNPTSGSVSGSTTIQVNANPVGLPNGNYAGSFVVTMAGIGSTNVPVQFAVGSGSTGGGSLLLSQSSLTFNTPSTAQLPTQQVITINSSTTQSVSFTASATTSTGGGWLTLSQASGTTPTSLVVSANPTFLATGSYFGNITITPIGGTPQTIPVTLTIGTGGGGTGGTCAVGLATPSPLTFNSAPGSTPVQQNLTINPGAGVSYSLSAIVNPAWLTIFNPFGTGQQTIPVQANPSGLPAGTYSASIRVTINNTTCDVPVTFTVSTTGGGTGSPTASPTSLIFNVPPGSTTQPNNQAITITTPAAAQFTATASVSGTGINWLAVGPNIGQTFSTGAAATATVNVGVQNFTALPVGLYNGTITITFTSGGYAPLTIPVTLNLGNAPTGSLTPNQLNFSFQTGGTNPPTQFLTVNTLNGASASFTATGTTSTGANWLNVAPASGTGPGVVAVSVNPGSLTAGTYSGTVGVQLAGSTNPISVPVTLIVNSNPVLRVNPTAAQFNYQIGGSVGAGQGQSIEVTSTGAPITFTATSTIDSPFGGTPWLSVSQSSITTPTTVSINVNAANLTAGTYTGVVSFTTPGQAPLNIPVRLTVSSAPLLNPTPRILNFTSQTNAAPTPLNLNISTTGGSVSITPTAVTSTGATWLTVSQSTSSTPTTLQISANPAGLAEGTYYGAVLITAAQNTAENSPLVVPVVYTVGGATNLTVRPGPLTFTQIQGAAAPAAQSLDVSSTGNLLTYTATVSTLNGSNWLTVSPVTNITPSSISVSVNGSSLPIGSYSGSVVISASGAGNTPQVVPITLNVIAAPNITVTPQSLTYTATTSGGNPASQTIQLASTGANVPFTAATTVSGGAPNWLTVTPTSGTTPTTLTVGVNTSTLTPGTYTGTVTITTGLAPINIPVTLTLSAVTPAQITSVTNAASFLPTAVTPGMITAIFGSNMGPTTITTARLTAQGTIDTNLASTRVLFDNIAAPLVYVRNDVISAIVPYEVAGRATTSVVVEYQGVRSQPVSIRVVDTAPAIFTANQQGTGAGAIQNQNGSTNTTGNAAARGEVATVYLTGEGQLSPGGQTGVIATGTRRIVAPVTVRVGGRDATVLYAGPVPTVVLGLGQVNFIIPNDAPTGANVPVEVIVGGVSTQGTVTMSVR